MNNFVSKRHVVSAHQHLITAPSKVFPLLCPQREYEWIPDWKCDIIYAESGYAEQDCIFTTHFPNDSFETWITDKYEKNKEIQFIRISEERTIRYSIRLNGNSDGTTSAVWKQTITALNEKGNSYIENFDDNQFSFKIKHLEKLLNHFLKTGEMLKI